MEWILPPFSVVIRYVRSCFWLLIPILALNLLFTKSLPPAFQADVFWRNIPRALAISENVLRVVVMILPTLVPLGVETRAQRVGVAVFVLGFGAYAGSWAALIVAPGSAWAMSAPGFTAPAWTPALWLLGLVLLAERSFIPRVRPRPIFAVCAVAFVALHVTHAALVFERTFR